MTTNPELHELQAGLNEISEFLLTRMIKDDYGFYWDTISLDDNGDFSYHFNPSLWNGTGGIAWFFLILYENYGKENDLTTAERSFAKIYRHSIEHMISNPSLYDGISGVIYLGLELFRVTGKNLYLDQALNLYRKYRERILAEQTEDLLIGISGILMSVCILYHYTEDQETGEDIVTLTTTLLEKTQLAESGIKWGKNHLSMDSLCGFSHGNAGIGFCLLQLGKYFDHPELIWFAEQVFRYEDLYYDPLKNNWMDLRWEASKNSLPDLFDWNKNTFLTDDFDLNAWAHGACGIGNARISAFRITADPTYKKDCEKVFERCKKDILTRSKRNHILFSGYGGLSDFLLQYHRTFAEQEALQLATDISLEGLRKSIAHQHSAWGVQNSEDLGLMTGTAGIGFSILQIIKSKSFNSILHSELPDTKRSDLFKDFRFKKHFFDRHYPKTLEFLKTFTPVKESVYDSDTIEEFSSALMEDIMCLPGNEADYLSDLHQFETFKIGIQMKHKGSLCFQTRLNILKKELTDHSENDKTDLLKKRFIRTPFISLYESKWNWKTENNKDSGPGKYINVFYSTDQDIFHLMLNPFPSAVLQLLETPLRIEELAEHFQYSEDKKEYIEEKLLEQIEELLTNYFVRIIEYY
ncbi:lanthionine synthetase LanC family protein [Chryseobacterium kwangjuense]|uniref:Lanthionine synthetase n=1 Tax=Chryseobacterium kwangjuense TaxID=267125 RepID=A0A135WIJ8_9FLAO|nr:lanthionine synthetase LanC family protein [Chryseobacterium kwangjuense]KXH84711.1 hypothetical protein AU378_02825 [Chryseobacterium kwangjuense]